MSAPTGGSATEDDAVAVETECRLRAELVAALKKSTSQLKRDLRDTLAELREMDDPPLPLQFEADCYWGIACCATEEPVFDSDCLDEALPADWAERADEAGLDWNALRESEICPWFAECWAAVKGPARYSPAYLFLHDYGDQQYHLEQRRWIPATEAFPGD